MNTSIALRVHIGLWETLGQDQAGSMAARPGEFDELIHGNLFPACGNVSWKLMKVKFSDVPRCRVYKVDSFILESQKVQVAKMDGSRRIV